jgi:phosphatidylinositol alpha-1,6-mannosyltransferase
MLLRRISLFLTNSDYTWDRFIQFNPEFSKAPHKTVNLGIGEVSQYVPAPTHTSAIILGRMSRSEDYKGHRELINVWPRIVAALPNAELWIAGTGDLEPELKEMVSRARVPGVRFFGAVSEEEKQRLLASSSCLVLPSRNEGFGLAYLEAMRLGRPCLVSTCDAGQEIVGPAAGIAVDPARDDELVGALFQLLRPQSCTRWSETTRKRYENNFTAQHFQNRLLEACYLTPATPMSVGAKQS